VCVWVCVCVCEGGMGGRACIFMVCVCVVFVWVYGLCLCCLWFCVVAKRHQNSSGMEWSGRRREICKFMVCVEWQAKRHHNSSGMEWQAKRHRRNNRRNIILCLRWPVLVVCVCDGSRCVCVGVCVCEGGRN
jgi:hypothetical protein